LATVVVILVAFRSEKLKPHVLAGLLIGLIGVLIVLGVWQGFGDNEPLAILALLAAITCYGIGTPYVRKHIAPLNLPTEVSVFGQIGTASISLLPFYLFSGPLLIATPSIVAILSVLAVGVLGSGIAYLLYYRVLDVVGSAIASSVTYITPVIAVILGVLILKEELHWYELVGGLIVILGAAISQGSILNLFRRQNA
jgi:drug/metabolite transporter (DMT)-like permease